jgi:hypothetical protein
MSLVDTLVAEIAALEARDLELASEIQSLSFELQQIWSIQSTGLTMPPGFNDDRLAKESKLKDLQNQHDIVRKTLAEKRESYNKLIEGISDNMGKGISEDGAIALAEAELEAERFKQLLKYGALAVAGLTFTVITAVLVAKWLKKGKK